MKAEIKNGNLIITIPITKPTPSATGKTLIVASSKGNITLEDVKVEGKPLTIGLNAYIKP